MAHGIVVLLALHQCITLLSSYVFSIGEVIWPSKGPVAKVFMQRLEGLGLPVMMIEN